MTSLALHQPSSWGYVQGRGSLWCACFLWDTVLPAGRRVHFFEKQGRSGLLWKLVWEGPRSCLQHLHAIKPSGASSSGETPGRAVKPFDTAGDTVLAIVQGAWASHTKKGTRKVRLQSSMPWFYPGDWCTNHLDFDLAQGYKTHLQSPIAPKIGPRHGTLYFISQVEFSLIQP